jgi:hypothetical protein
MLGSISGEKGEEEAGSKLLLQYVSKVCYTVVNGNAWQCLQTDIYVNGHKTLFYAQFLRMQ